MAYFSVVYTYADAPGALDEHRPRHRAYLSGLAARDQVVASGPLLQSDPPQALLVFRAGGREQLDELLAADPFQQLGLVARTEVHEWNPVVGILAG